MSFNRRLPIQNKCLPLVCLDKNMNDWGKDFTINFNTFYKNFTEDFRNLSLHALFVNLQSQLKFYYVLIAKVF